jgi:hypothetical protein
MTVRNDIVQGIREWVKAFGDPAGALADNQVIKADQDGPRPAVPYVTVKVTTLSVVGVDERLTYDNAGQGTVKVRGIRRAVVQCTAYGTEAAEWLSYALLVSGIDAAMDQLSAAGISIDEGSTMTDLSALMDTAIENRTLQELRVLYCFESTPVTGINLLTAQAAVTYDPEGADPLTDTIIVTITVTP